MLASWVCLARIIRREAREASMYGFVALWADAHIKNSDNVVSIGSAVVTVDACLV